MNNKKYKNIIKHTFIIESDKKTISGKISYINWGNNTRDGNGIDLFHGNHIDYPKYSFRILVFYNSKICMERNGLILSDCEGLNEKISVKFKTEKRAKKIMKLINSITIKEVKMTNKTKEELKKKIVLIIMELETRYKDKIKNNNGDFDKLRNDGYKEGITDFKELLEEKFEEEDLGEGSKYF